MIVGARLRIKEELCHDLARWDIPSFVLATDTGDAGVPLSSEITLPIVVTNANRAPVVGDVTNAFVDKGAVLEIPIYATDVDGNPVQLTLAGLPRFATYTQNPSAVASQISGVLRFAPGEGDRGDYAMTVTAQDNPSTGSGQALDGNINQTLAEAKSFILTVRSASEAPQISMPGQVVALAGQPLSVAVSVRDLDQDALTFSAQGLPLGAVLTPQTQYGQALLTWTPSLDDVGSHSIEIKVTDSGMGPQDAGYVPDPNVTPVPNVRTHTLRVLVREANLAPEVLGVQASGGTSTDQITGTNTITQVSATEGVPLTLEIFGRDADADLIAWSTTNLPAGMQVQAAAGGRLILNWLPGNFAAQSGNGATSAQYLFSVTGSDGAAQVTRQFQLDVANINLTPVLLAMPLQLVTEGQTLGFTLRGGDADAPSTSSGQAALRYALLHDASTPAGIAFDANSGYFEWTPEASVVDNATRSDQAFTLNFSVSDGTASATQSVQVRLFDVNRTPRVTASNHAVVVGNTLSLPVQLGGNTASAIVAIDDDGAAQTQALSVSFAGLPEGATHDAQTRRLVWTPGPGQVGDYVVTAIANDSRNTGTQSFTLRVVAEAQSNAPKILISTTPSTPALPGQLVVATVRAEGYSAIQTLAVQVRGEALGTGSTAWQSVALDGAGRLRLTPAQPGLIEIQVQATDADGFSATRTQLVRVKDPADTQAPALAWGGALRGATQQGEPVNITATTQILAALQEQQLMGYQLEIAPAGTNAWSTLSEQSESASNVSALLALATLDPASLHNGVYSLRLTAWDLAGRTRELNARVIIDSAQKTIQTQSATDGIFTLAGHAFALTRTLKAGTFPPPQAGEGQGGGNASGLVPNTFPPLLAGEARVGASATGASQPWTGASPTTSPPPRSKARRRPGKTGRVCGCKSPPIWRPWPVVRCPASSS